MEPHATLARWGVDGTLTLFDTTQHIFGTKELVAIVLGMPLEKIRVVSEFLGGGFGGKAYVWPHTLLAAMAAKVLGQPVRIQLTRAQMYSMAGHQPATIQTIALGADTSGKLTGIRHESISPTSVFDDYIEYAANATRFLWRASGNIATGHKIVHVNRNTPTAMRSPHEALGHFALECAMDELAYSAGIDPVQLRLLNDSDIDPFSGRPFSTRRLRQCLIEGAERFNWSKRAPEPRSMRDGHYLIGQGVAAAVYTHWRWPAKARVTLRENGTALVEAGMHDLGTGTYTVMQQVAAEALGLPADKVTVRLGDTRLPESHAAIGSATMANAGAAVLLAAKAAREKAVHTNEPVVAEADYDPVEEANGPKAIFSFAAIFAEVRVDEDLGQVRLRRLVGAYDAGRIINPKLARSQAIGGIIWGTGQALMERSETDPALGRFLHRNYSGYLVPTNADIPELDVLFCGRFDEEASPLGAKGLGELTAVSVAPAIANAVYHATGKRVRDLPITIETIMANG
jgi:xanthine dehydrogenase YagR molybdenum-binding subunit